MDQTALFLFFLFAILMAWLGPRVPAMVLFGVAVALTAADFLHHATDALKLSF